LTLRRVEKVDGQEDEILVDPARHTQELMRAVLDVGAENQ
jgi:hypothetical protein